MIQMLNDDEIIFFDKTTKLVNNPHVAKVCTEFRVLCRTHAFFAHNFPPFASHESSVHLRLICFFNYCLNYCLIHGNFDAEIL
jgi:hypothetical protein